MFATPVGDWMSETLAGPSAVTWWRSSCVSMTGLLKMKKMKAVFFKTSASAADVIFQTRESELHDQPHLDEKLEPSSESMKVPFGSEDPEIAA